MIKQFYKPTSLEEAMLLKEKYGHSITWFAGGAHFNHISFQARYEKVIALEGLGLHAIHSKQGHISIGATVTLQKLADNSLIPKPLRKAAAQAATRSIRNIASVGGDIAVSGRKTRLVPCLIALKATVVTGSGQNVPVEEFVQAGSRDLILKVCLPTEGTTCCIRQFRHQANAPVLFNVAISIERSAAGDTANAIVAIGSMEETPRRLQPIEELIMTNKNLNLETLSEKAAEQIQPLEDALGSSAFKKYIAGQTIAACIMNCLEEK